MNEIIKLAINKDALKSLEILAKAKEFTMDELFNHMIYLSLGFYMLDLDLQVKLMEMASEDIKKRNGN